MFDSTRHGRISDTRMKRRFAVASWLSLALVAQFVCASPVAAQAERPTKLLQLGKVKPNVRLVAQTGHRRLLDAVAVSADGRLVLTCGSDGVRLWESSSGAELQYIPTVAVQ